MVAEMSPNFSPFTRIDRLWLTTIREVVLLQALKFRLLAATF